MKLLIIAAHPDDEILGAGGLAARCAREGDEVFIHILGEGISSRSKSPVVGEISELRTAAVAASKILGVSHVEFHGLPDNRLDSIDLLEVIRIVEAIVSDHSPDCIATHSLTDLNIDHQVTARAVVTATRPVGIDAVRSVFSFEILSSTEWGFGNLGAFEPNYFIEISARDLEQKIEALRCYKSELRDSPHPRSINSLISLARLRGSTIGVEFAEAFHLIRRIDPLKIS